MEGKELGKLNKSLPQRLKTTMIYGEKEPKIIHRKAKETHKKIRNSKLYKADNAKHNISQKEYQDKVYEALPKT